MISLAACLASPRLSAGGPPSRSPSKVERLAERLGRGGWDRSKVHRLIAFVEQDGRVSHRERAALGGLLERRPRGPDNFRGHARAELARYVKLADAIRSTPTHAGALLFDQRAKLDPARYRRNVEVLSGQRQARLIDSSGQLRKLRFENRYIGHSGNQLDEVRRWLGAQYRALDFTVEEQPVRWRGHTYHNLIITIPGDSPEAVAICDHYDTADKEVIERRNLVQLTRDHHLSKAEIRERLGSLPVGAAVPGADDNASASAALLEMGHVLRAKLDQGARLHKTIKLVHLVGEELPASCLGARTFVEQARRRGERLSSVIVMDMIGVDRVGQRKVQLSVGRPEGSMEIARIAKSAIQDQKLDLKPVFRPYGSRKSFLHQTDAIVFSRKGIPVILFNEHLNDDRDHFRVGYHDEFDIPRLMNFDFATSVARAALETAYRLAR